jgi:hypothetical protein
MNQHKKAVIGLIVVSAFCFVARPSAAQQSQQRDLKKVSAPTTVNGSELFGESHAVIFGVSDYNNGLKKLPGVKDDVKAVSEVLRQHGFTVKVVMNPTRAVFDQAMRDFISEHGQADQNRLLIYFAGHGHTMKNRAGMEGYLIPVDAPHPDRDEVGFRKSAIKFDFMEVYAKEINSKHALFVFDSCFSGALFNIRGNASLPSSIASVAGRPVRQFITSGSADETVPDKSVFRQLFVDGLNGEADWTGDGYITGTELGVYLHDKVTDYRKGAQTPQYGKIKERDLDRGEFVFLNPLGVSSQNQANPNTSPVVTAPQNSTLGSIITPANPTNKTVPFLASSGWVYSGLRVQRGQQVEITITYSGVSLGKFGPASPDGVLAQDDKRPLKSCPTGAAIVRIADGGDLICVRASSKFTVQQDGALYLNLNESNSKDNTGTVLAKVSIYP